MNTTTLDQIEHLEARRAEVGLYLRASEDWSVEYMKDQRSFKKLLMQERKMERVMREYLRAFSGRVHRYVNWSEYSRRLTAADLNIVLNLEETDEGTLLVKTIHDPLLDMMATGTEAGNAIYRTTSGLSRTSELLQQAARERARYLVKGLLNTSQNRIRQSLETSLTLGLNNQEAADALLPIVKDYGRAELIARTESTNAYTKGLELYGQQTGASTKTWQAVANPCAICDELADDNHNTVDIGESFHSDILDEDIENPGAHPNCNCGVVLNYDSGGNGDNSIDDSGE